jgi:NAD(P)-dependent dehydrogenase (short-subunit alcohol dehydrogenase family)
LSSWHQESDMADDANVVVITGGSGGIGAALARRLGDDGLRIALAARREPELREVAKDAEARGAAGTLVFPADVTRREDVLQLRDATVHAFGRIDVWVNNAGRGITRSVLDVTEAEFDEMMAVNVKSALYGMQTAVPYFIKHGGSGHVINVSSFLGRVPVASFRSAYSAAKAALNSLTTNLRMDLRDYPNIHVSLVMPGVVTTDFARNVVGEARPPMAAPAGPGGTRMLPQTAEEVADVLARVIREPVAEVYTNPASADVVRQFYADPGAFVAQLGGVRPELTGFRPSPTSDLSPRLTRDRPSPPPSA